MAPVDSVPALNERRRRAVALRIDGATLAEAARVSGLSVPTVVAACKAWREGGWAAVDVRPRGRKPRLQQHLTPSQEAQCLQAWTRPGAGLWTLSRAVEDLRAAYPPLAALAATQLEPLVTRLWQRAGLSPPSPWDRWRADPWGPQAAWCERDLPALREAAREAGATLLALGEQTLPGRERAQLSAHTGRGVAWWWVTSGWPTEADWVAFMTALRAAWQAPLWLVTENRWMPRGTLVARWLADAGVEVRVLHLPPSVPVAPGVDGSHTSTSPGVMAPYRRQNPGPSTLGRIGITTNAAVEP